jgi:hypothetical protein
MVCYAHAVDAVHSACMGQRAYKLTFSLCGTCVHLLACIDVDYKRILEITPNSQLAQDAVRRLPPIIEEKLERDKAEMLGKLKDLGNVVLGKLFGISLDNLQFQQDPTTGSYSMNMRQ